MNEKKFITNKYIDKLCKLINIGFEKAIQLNFT